ncbi:hypothetical protein CEXT_275931 [Caerostris extrusa]|uniref:Uncharacterized protein n=1 Tax=Caerostris extrusa TaxID=172846 RepID=A0AAV4PD11_CAEEX|nr:hypothetical protein CEXT_275931 [Caerostris extrusa]
MQRAEVGTLECSESKMRAQVQDLKKKAHTAHHPPPALFVSLDPKMERSGLCKHSLLPLQLDMVCLEGVRGFFSHSSWGGD